MTWNLFHGRDWPPVPELQVRGHKGNFRRGPRRGSEYEQAGIIKDGAKMINAEAHRVLSARNWLAPLTGLVARWRPDLLGAWEGGSNLTLVREAAGPIVERKRIALTRRPELRIMALTRLESGLCVANMHVSTKPSSAEAELLAAARWASDFAGTGPLLFGGDFNVRPKASQVFDQLAERFALAASTAPDRLSHLLARGLEVIERPAAWPPEARDIVDPETGLKIRLSDHNPVMARFSAVE